MANAFSTLLGGTSGGAVRQYDFITQSKTFVCNATGTLDMLLVGGNPSGGVVQGAGFVGGGGAGGVCVKRWRVSKGDSYVVTIGAGGAAVSRSTAGQTQGLVGGTSTVVGPGVNMSATSGQPGEAKATKPANGGAGGTATGGDDNRTSGAGGSVTATTATRALCGTGAVNVLGIPADQLRGGNINSTAAAEGSGGAGVGGRGGDVLGANISGTAGGGSGGPAMDSPDSVAGPNIAGEQQAASPPAAVAFAGWGVDLFGGGSASAAAAGPGGGGAATNGSTPGSFAGWGGGLNNSLNANGNRGPGRSGYVGSGTATSGAGAQGCAIFILRV